MMQFYFGDTLLLGITKRNLNKLMEGKPIQLEVKGKESIKVIGIVYGESKPAILEELQKAGMNIPHWMWDSARNDPS